MAAGYRPRVGSFMETSLVIFQLSRREVSFEADDSWSEFIAALVLFREHHDQFSLSENPFLTPMLIASADAVEPDRQHKYWGDIAHIAVPFGEHGFGSASPTSAEPPVEMVTTSTRLSPLPEEALLSRD